MATTPGVSTVKKAEKLTGKEDMFGIFKTMSSRPEYYKPVAADIEKALSKKDLSTFGLNSEEQVIAQEALRSIREYGYVHPKIGILIRQLDKETKNQSPNDEN